MGWCIREQVTLNQMIWRSLSNLVHISDADILEVVKVENSVAARTSEGDSTEQVRRLNKAIQRFSG